MLEANKFKNEVKSSFSNRHLNLIIFPTEKCNFRCTYCYEDFKIGKMKQTVVESLKRLLDHRLLNLDSLEFSWFGGEPMLASSIILELHDYAIRNKNKDCIIKGNMSTNGHLLTKEKFSELVNLGLTQYQISLDGFNEIHDKTRVLINGKGTFEKIWNNLKEFRSLELNFEIILRLHYSKSTYENLIPLIKEINTVFKDDSRFKIYLKSIENLGGPHSNDIEETTYNEQLHIEKILNDLVSQRITKFQINQDGPYICYASKPNSIAIRADGRLSKCTVALNSDSNILGKIKEDGTLDIDNEKLRNWFIGFETQDLGTLACPMNAVINKITTANNVYKK